MAFNLDSVKSTNEASVLYMRAQEDPAYFAESFGISIEDVPLVIEDLKERLTDLKESMVDSFEYHLGRVNEINLMLPWIEDEIKRLQELKKSYQTELDRRKDWIKFCMQATNTEKLETKLNKLSMRRTEAVVVSDSEEVINSLTQLWYTRTKVEADKTKIKEAIKNWEEIIWCQIVENKSLIIK